MTNRLAALAAVLITFLASPVSAQTPGSQEYLSRLDNTRVSELADGRTQISLDAVEGDLRGVLTLTLSSDGDSYKGVWAFSATFLEDLRADGTPIAPSDRVGHDHDDPSTPAMHREYAHMRRDGALTGTVDAATLFRTTEGAVVAITAATLSINNGSRNFKDAGGSGRIGPWPSLPRELTLYLNVQVAQ